MRLTLEQWSLIAPLIPPSPRKDARGRPRRNDRDILDGILWILRTGAQWKELPKDFPPYQTCHRRFQEWVKKKVFEKILTVLAEDMEKRGKIDVKECFIDGTFASAKKGDLKSEKPKKGRVQRSWLSETFMVFRSVSTWILLARMKSLWWQRRLPNDLSKRIQNALWVTGHTTPIPWIKSLK